MLINSYIPYVVPYNQFDQFCQFNGYYSQYPVRTYPLYPYFNYPYYAVPVHYAETDYQLDRNISRKEKGIPLKKFLKPKSTPTGMPTPEGTSTGMPTPKGISIPYVPFSNSMSPISSSKDGPYGDITNVVESTDKFK
ncbi:hypothetical protein ABEX44_15370 [Priestia megaterium]